MQLEAKFLKLANTLLNNKRNIPAQTQISQASRDVDQVSQNRHLNQVTSHRLIFVIPLIIVVLILVVSGLIYFYNSTSSEQPTPHNTPRLVP